ncbi:MAG TPA: hypothetical protein VIG33_08550 [Pseudobdellovibrionaceae bacterium]
MLKTIWRWKVLNYPLAKELCFKKISANNAYRKVRRLIHEGYIEEALSTKIDLYALRLTQKGFNKIKYDIGYVTQERYLPQSVSHDYWAMAFQLGEYAFNPNKDVEFVTEQELQVTDSRLLPDWIPTVTNHIPDGCTKIKNAENSSYIAIEVELNAKPDLRYVHAAYYFEGVNRKIDTVLWLCDGNWLMERIFKLFLKLNLKRMEIHHFVLLEDFKKYGWDCQLRSGHEKNKIIRDVYAPRPHQLPGQTRPNPLSGKMHELFFSSKKSPWKPKV